MVGIFENCQDIRLHFKNIIKLNEYKEHKDAFLLVKMYYLFNL